MNLNNYCFVVDGAVVDGAVVDRLVVDKIVRVASSSGRWVEFTDVLYVLRIIGCPSIARNVPNMAEAL